MPAFTFEKISPPRDRGEYASTPLQAQPQGVLSQQRNNVTQVLGRFVEARVRGDGGEDQAPPRRQLPK